jgi:hypothetical protein
VIGLVQARRPGETRIIVKVITSELVELVELSWKSKLPSEILRENPICPALT